MSTYQRTYILSDHIFDGKGDGRRYNKGLVVGGDDYITTVGNFSMGSQYDCS